jgi:hypothetical protein
MPILTNFWIKGERIAFSCLRGERWTFGNKIREEEDTL